MLGQVPGEDALVAADAVAEDADGGERAGEVVAAEVVVVGRFAVLIVPPSRVARPIEAASLRPEGGRAFHVGA